MTFFVEADEMNCNDHNYKDKNNSSFNGDVVDPTSNGGTIISNHAFDKDIAVVPSSNDIVHNANVALHKDTAVHNDDHHHNHNVMVNFAVDRD